MEQSEIMGTVVKILTPWVKIMFFDRRPPSFLVPASP